MPTNVYFTQKAFEQRHPKLPRKELEKIWRQLKHDTAVELVRKVDLQMAFYGEFQEINIDKEDVFATNRQLYSQAATHGKLDKQLNTEVMAELRRVEKSLKKEFAKRVNEEKHSKEIMILEMKKNPSLGIAKKESFATKRVL